MTLIFVRARRHSAILFRKFGEEPVAVGDVVVLGAKTSVNAERDQLIEPGHEHVGT
ncbi:MAG: hypothetical protein H0X20_00650 [Chloroflexi bacterium]|nr:hypothetical protein [Chloroflexota bacterium]